MGMMARQQGQPRLSVCMATCNGRRFIAEQVASILGQLGPDDEVLVCDDRSDDGTADYLRQIGDPRVVVVVNERRLGHVRNFERCAARARGEVVFFSDQDDRWAPDKVLRTLAVFAADPEVLMVHHALRLVDAAGAPLGRSIRPAQVGRQSPGRFLRRQLVRGQTYGCATAVRLRALDVLLPFPASVYAHDHWMAIAMAVSGGLFMSDAELIDYRQHANNLSPKKPAALRKQLVWRLQSLGQIAEARARCAMAGLAAVCG